MNKKLFRVATVPESLNILLTGQLRYMNEFYKVTAISSPGEELLELEKREGVKTQGISMERKISPLKDLVSLYKLYRYFKKEKPDIVHSITPKGGLLTMLAAKLAGVPIRMHTFTGLIFPYKDGFFKIVLIWMDKLLSYCATNIYPEGNGVKEDLERFKITRKPLKVIANGNVNGIDLRDFDAKNITEEEIDGLKRQLEINENDFVFIFLGRIVRDKGINELISAFKTLCEHHVYQFQATVDTEEENERSNAAKEISKSSSNFRLSENYFYTSTSITGLRLRKRLGKILYGYNMKESAYSINSELYHYASIPGLNSHLSLGQNHNLPNIKLLLVGAFEQELNPILRITLAEIEKNPNIITTGFVKDVRPYLALSNCLVLPSYREGFPNSVLQAGAMGLPSIVTDISGCNEIIIDGKNGLIIPTRSEEAIIDAMLHLLKDEAFTQSLKIAARKNIEESYSHDKLWDEIRAEYDCLLEKYSI